MLVGPSPGSWWCCGGGEALQAGGSWEGAWKRHLQSSRPPGQALSIKHRKKRKLKGKGQAPAGVMGIPVASNLARRVGDLPPES